MPRNESATVTKYSILVPPGWSQLERPGRYAFAYGKQVTLDIPSRHDAYMYSRGLRDGFQFARQFLIDAGWTAPEVQP